MQTYFVIGALIDDMMGEEDGGVGGRVLAWASLYTGTVAHAPIHRLLVEWNGTQWYAIVGGGGVGGGAG